MLNSAKTLLAVASDPTLATIVDGIRAIFTVLLGILGGSWLRFIFGETENWIPNVVVTVWMVGMALFAIYLLDPLQ